MHLLTPKRTLIAVTALLVTALLGASAMMARRSNLKTPAPASPAAERLSGLPPVILWAWERPENLDFIDTRQVGVAFLAQTLYLRGGRVVVRPRLQPLKVPNGTALVAVTRIESDHVDEPTLSDEQLGAAVAAIADLTRKPNLTALQIDFDATLSERDFYRALIVNLRRRTPENVPLSLTALASWCMHDDWLSGLPVDEAVPMLFRMGVERRQVHAHLDAGGDFRPRVCRDSSGISTDEPLPNLPATKRTYIFNPRSWSREAVSAVVESD